MKKIFLLAIAFFMLSQMLAQEVTEPIVLNKNFSNNNVSGINLWTQTTLEAIPMPIGQNEMDNSSENSELLKTKSASRKRILAAGESLIFSIDGSNITEDTTHLGITFSGDIEAAIQRVPSWLQYDLRFKFKMISNSATRNKMVNIINASPKKYLDEVAYVITYLPVEVLTYNRLPNDWSHLIDNAAMIYSHADSLKYVNIVEYGDTTSGDWHTTTSYKIKQGSSYIWREVDRYYYYQFIVMPKVEQEYVAITDNLTSITGYRTWGYFWRDYLWNNYSQAINTSDTEDRSYDQVNTWGYVAINSAGDRDTVRIDSIPRLGEIMQMPEYLWNESHTMYFFNRDFSATQGALDVLGNWASRCIPQDVTSSDDYRPSEPNHIAWKHVGNCHEDAILLAAAARTALIPCIHVADLCDDHVWTAIHDGGDDVWHHFEFFRGGCSAGRPYYWGMTNLTTNGSYGWNSSLVQGYVPSGQLMNLSETYSENTACTLNLSVKDQDGKPVDGALVHIYSTNTQYGTTYNMSAGYLWTNSEGKISAKLGTGKKYYMSISHPKFGSYPTTSGQIYQLISSNTTAGHTYNLSYSFPDPATEARHNIFTNQETYDAHNSLKINLTSENITTGTNPEDVQSSTFYERTNTVAPLSVYVVSESELDNFRNGSRNATVEYDCGHISQGEISVPLHNNGKTYIVVANDNNYKNLAEVSFSYELVDTVSFPTSIENIFNSSNDNNFKIYPNPVKEQMRFTCNDNYIGMIMEIYDISGRKVGQHQISENNGEVDTRALAPGLYIVRCGTQSIKMIKGI